MTNSRQKGARGEREAAKVLGNILSVNARRGQQFSGLEGKDVVLDAPGLHVECKRVERLNIHDAVEQADRDAAEGETPLVIHRKNNTPWLVTILAEDLVELSRRVTAIVDA